MKHRIAQRMRARRNRVGFATALANAEPSMQRELIAIAARQDAIR
jgi:hypothetical protein